MFKPFRGYQRGPKFAVPGGLEELVAVFASYAEGQSSLGELSELIREYLVKYGNRFDVVAPAPLAPEIYVELISRDLIRIRAGSTAVEFWAIDIALSYSPGKVHGHARFIPPPKVYFTTDVHWVGNVPRLFMAIEGAAQWARGS